jgi:plastocyanin
MHKTVLAALIVSVSLIAASSAFSRSSAITLNGTVGPGFTIHLTKAGKAVKTLKHGTYKFKINDKSGAHNFALKGAMKKTLTSIGFVGKKTVTIKLKKGKYTFYCVPHASIMHGSFTVK